MAKKNPANQRITSLAEGTKRFAAKFVENLPGGEVIALYGDLGSGKTTFVQGIAKALGVKERVQSPTFVLLKSYKINSKLKSKNLKLQLKIQNLIHVDLYRIKSIDEAKEIGIEEYFDKPDTVVFIEWPEIIGEILPENTIKIKFEHLQEDKRKITVSLPELQNAKYRKITN